MNGGQRLDFGGQRPDSLQIYIFGISIPNARCMQNLGSIRPLGAILRPPVLIKRDFAVPLFFYLEFRLFGFRKYPQLQWTKSSSKVDLGEVYLFQISFILLLCCWTRVGRGLTESEMNIKFHSYHIYTSFEWFLHLFSWKMNDSKNIFFQFYNCHWQIRLKNTISQESQISRRPRLL